MPERRRHLAVDLLVGLAEEMAPLGVAEDDETAAELHEHDGGDLAREGALVLPVGVLRSPPDGRAREDLSHRGQRREGRTDHHFHPARPLEPVAHGEGELPRFGDSPVHLPVADDEGSPHQAVSSRAATPGSVRPSRNSRKAPPAVEM